MSSDPTPLSTPAPTPIDEDHPWEQLEEIVESGDAEEAGRFIAALPAETLNIAISRLDDEAQSGLLELLGGEASAELLERLPDEQSADLLDSVSADRAATILSELSADEQADIIGVMGRGDGEAILREMSAEESKEIRDIMDYDPHSAGGLMATEFLTLNRSLTVAEALRQMAENEGAEEDLEIRYVYVLDADRLVGVIRLNDLIARSGRTPLSAILIANPLSVRVDARLEEFLPQFEDSAFLGLPVIDESEHLVGVLTRRAVMEAKEQRARNVFLKVSGIIGGEEYRSMSLVSRSLRRLAFLAPNIILNLVAASVIALYQDTLEAVIALAVFLPIVSDMSGCSGNQAVAVSIRELALGLIRPGEVWRVFVKEGALGVINGMVLGTLLGTVAGLWQGNFYLGLVVGGALALNTVLSVLLGGLIPLAFCGAKIDPALASGPILTTVTDMCGFFLVLSFANLALAYIA